MLVGLGQVTTTSFVIGLILFPYKPFFPKPLQLLIRKEDKQTKINKYMSGC